MHHSGPHERSTLQPGAVDGGTQPMPATVLDPSARTVLSLQRTVGNRAVRNAIGLPRRSSRTSDPEPGISLPPRGRGSDLAALTLGDLELRRAVTARSTPSRAASRWPTTQVLHRQSTTESDSGHLNRNRFNVLSKGNLSPIGDALSSFEYREGHSNSYRDEAGLVWELLPDSMNIYHQPAGATKPYPNKKLLHKDSSGGSSEAIRQPDGTYLTTGPSRALTTTCTQRA